MSLDGFLGGAHVRAYLCFIICGLNWPYFRQQTPQASPITDRSCLIMDEVDGMSAGDRGGVGALNALIKKSKVGKSLVIVSAG